MNPMKLVIFDSIMYTHMCMISEQVQFEDT